MSVTSAAKSRGTSGRGTGKMYQQPPAIAGDASEWQDVFAGDGGDERPITLASIHPDPKQPRKTFDEAKLAELAASIRQHGVLQPLLVRETDQGYLLVFGERRFRAAQIAGLKAVPCRVRKLTDLQAAEFQLIENDQREDLDWLERARGYQQLMDLHGRTVDDLVTSTGRSKAWIYGCLKLLDLPKEAAAALADGRLSASTAQLIGRLPSESMRQQATEAILDPNYERLSDLFGQRLDYHWETHTNDEKEPLSFRLAKEFVSQLFMRELKQAKWSLNELDLVPEAGSCEACPRRTGNARDLYPEGRADVCTDPACFARKEKAYTDRLVEESRAKGRTVLDGKEAEKHFVKNGGHHLSYQGQYVAVDDSEWIDGKNRGLKKALGKELAEDLVLLRAPDGELVEVYPRARVQEELRKKFPKSKVTTASSSAEDERWRQRRARERAKEKLAAEVGRRCQVAVREAAATLFAGVVGWDPKRTELLRLLVAGHARECRSIIQTAVLHAHQEKGGHHQARVDKIEDVLKGLDARKLFGVWAEMQAARHAQAQAVKSMYGGDGSKREAKDFLAALGVKWEAIEKEVKAEQSEKQARKAAKPKAYPNVAASLPKKSQTRVGQCRVCGCTEQDCRDCVERTGEECHWIDDKKQDLCSACLPLLETELGRVGLPKKVLVQLVKSGLRTVADIHGRSAVDLLLNTKPPIITEIGNQAIEAVAVWLKEQLHVDEMGEHYPTDPTDPRTARPYPTDLISDKTILMDLVVGDDYRQVGEALAAADLHTVGDLLNRVRPGKKHHYAVLREVKGISPAAVLEIGDAIVDSGLVHGEGSANGR